MTKPITPDIRFKEFNEEWTTTKLGNILNYEQPTKYIVESDKYIDNQQIPVLTAGKSLLLGYTNETQGIYRADDNKRVIIFDDFTTSSHIINYDFKVKSSALKLLTTTSDKFNLYFVHELINSINYQPGNHERHWISIFAKFDVLVPSKTEQDAIGNFFKELDNKIELEEQNLKKVKQFKKSMLQKMFPKGREKEPKIRFKEFNEEWTTTKLGNILNYEQPTKYIVESDKYIDNQQIPVLTAGKSLLLGYTNETQGIYRADDNKRVIIFDDFTTSSHIINYDFKVKSSALKLLTTTSDKFNLYFVHELINSINYQPGNHERHWISIFAKFDVLVPSKAEQDAIGGFFKELDNKIELEEQNLEKLNQFKKSMLQKMFV